MLSVRPNWKRWPLVLAAFLVGALPVFAHEKWFVEPGEVHHANLNAEVLASPYGILVLVSVLLFMGAAWWYGRRADLDGFDARIEKLSRRFKLHPRPILSAIMGVSIMGAGLQKTLFAPNLALPETAWGIFLAWAAVGVGQAFIFFESFLPELSVLMILLYLAGFTVIPPLELLEELLIVGIGVYFITSETRREPWKRWNTEARRRSGYHLFRVLVGVSFLILSTVKWLRPDLGMVLVGDYPSVNFASGFGIDAAMFIFSAGVIETAVAVAILTRVAFRPALVAAFLVFTLSIYVFGFRELLGHLPIKAALFTLFLYGHWRKGDRNVFE